MNMTVLLHNLFLFDSYSKLKEYQIAEVLKLFNLYDEVEKKYIDLDTIKNELYKKTQVSKEESNKAWKIEEKIFNELNEILFSDFFKWHKKDLEFVSKEDIESVYNKISKENVNNPFFMYELITLNKNFVYCLSDELKENETFLYALFDLLYNNTTKLKEWSLRIEDVEIQYDIKLEETPELFYFFVNCISERLRNNETFMNNLRTIRKQGIGALNNPVNTYKYINEFADLSEKFKDKTEDEIVDLIIDEKILKDYDIYDISNILLSLPSNINIGELFKKLFIKEPHTYRKNLNIVLDSIYEHDCFINDEEFCKEIIRKRISNNYRIYNNDCLYSFFNKYKDDEEFVKQLINDYLDSVVFSLDKKFLTENQFKYGIDLAKSRGTILSAKYYDSYIEYILLHNGSKLLEKLRAKFGKSYEQYATKNKIDVNDDSLFLYKMFTSNVLVDILSNDYYNENDVVAVKAFINYFKDRTDYNVDGLYERVNSLGQKYALLALKEVTKIFNSNSNNPEFEEILTSYGYTKENFFKKVCNKKYLDKKLKESLLLKLGGYYRTNIITASDIMDIMLEMHERQLTINQILKEKSINKSFFDKIYMEAKERNPILFDYIHSLLKENSIRGFKKLLKLYYSLMDFSGDKEAFINQYNEEPEEMIEKFKGTPLYDDINSKLSTLTKEKGLK